MHACHAIICRCMHAMPVYACMHTQCMHIIMHTQMHMLMQINAYACICMLSMHIPLAGAAHPGGPYPFFWGGCVKPGTQDIFVFVYIYLQMQPNRPTSYLYIGKVCQCILSKFSILHMLFLRRSKYADQQVSKSIGYN